MSETVITYDVHDNIEGFSSYRDLIRLLDDSGGSAWFSSVIEGSESLLSENKARRDVFLHDADKQNERISLLKDLEAWADALQADKGADDMSDYCLSEAEGQSQVLQHNLLKVISIIKPIEVSYRGLALFFENAENSQVRNVSFINCATEQLKDLDAPRYFDYISEELRKNFDRIDLRNNYSLLVLPGYLGSNAVIEKWAKAAYENKVIIITDFEDFDDVDDVLEVFDAAGLSGGDVYRSSVLMCCNWLIGRGRHNPVNEEHDLYLPPSMALAGKIYVALLSQVSAGKRFGIIYGAEGAKFSLKKSEVSVLERMGLVPMFGEYGKVMAFSAKTLFNGANLGLQIYSVVRVFDYVTKVLMDFLNRRAFENFNANIRKELMGQIVKFLDSISGNGRLIEDFNIQRFEQDALQKDKIHLNIHLKPYFPAKNFMIKMAGQKDEEGAKWDTAYDQQ
ncbi:type VI secretion system contractile sheath protein TssC [Niabella aquatica]